MEYPFRSKLITSLYSAFICSSLFSKRLEHLGDALFLLFHVRANIEIKGCCNIGMIHAMDNTPLKKVVSHRFEPTSKFILLLIGCLALSLVISIWGNLTQWREHQAWEVADLKYRALKMVLPSGDPNVRYIESHNMTWQETCLIWFHI